MLEHTQQSFESVQPIPSEVAMPSQEPNLLGGGTHVDQSAPTTAMSTTWTPVELSKSVDNTYLTDKSISGFKTVDDLAKAYLNANKLIGKRIQDLHPDEVKALNIKAGSPASKDEYDFGEVGIDKTDAEKYKDVMFKLGIPKDAAKEFVAWQNKETEQRIKYEEQTIIQQANQNVDDLKKEFGTSFDERISLANKALTHFGGSELAKIVNEYGLGTNPALIKALVKAGQLISEGSMPAATARAVGMTPSEIDAKIREIRNSPEYDRHVRFGNGAQKETILRELDTLYKMKHGG